MAARKRRKRGARSRRCQRIRRCGRTYTVCRNAKGQIVSNTPVGGRKRRRRKASTTRRRTTRRKATNGRRTARMHHVTKEIAITRSGKIRKGCRPRKGGGFMCKWSAVSHLAEAKRYARSKRGKRRAAASAKRRCRFGVNKRTGKCLKHKRRK